tara:strand:- start:24 stop:704 length:681 start_codon:yes stop_codon:yes gene_type:complete
MSEIRVNKLINEAGTGSVELTQGATLPSGKTLSGAGSLNITGISTFGGNVSIAGTLTYQDVTNIDSVGLITARSGINVTGGNTTIKGAVESVAAGAYTGSGNVLTCDTATATVFTHDLQSGTVGIVSITNFPATSASFHTITLLLRQNDTGTAHTTNNTGIQTITVTPTGVAGFTTAPLVGSGTTVILGATANDENFVTLGINYNGGTNTDASSYKVFVTKNGDFR